MQDGGSGTSFRFAILSYIFLELRMEEASFVEIFKFQRLRSRQVPRKYAEIFYEQFCHRSSSRIIENPLYKNFHNSKNRI